MLYNPFLAGTDFLLDCEPQNGAIPSHCHKQCLAYHAK